MQIIISVSNAFKSEMQVIVCFKNVKAAIITTNIYNITSAFMTTEIKKSYSIKLLKKLYFSKATVA